MKKTFLLIFTLFLITVYHLCVSQLSDVHRVELDEEDDVILDKDIGSSRDGSKTDDEVIIREEEAIKLDGLNVAQIKELRESAEKFVFQAEVNRMMKLIINSLYRNKEIFLRELISNASDALDKIRLLSLTDKNALDATEEQVIRIKADKDNHVLHITDTGVGMTKQDLINNLGTIAKSGTSEFLSKLANSASSQDAGDLIGQFGVGFYSAFLVADRIIVTSKHNDDKQHIWESDASSFSVAEDPRGDTLKRGTTISLYLKEEAYDFLEQDTVRNLILKYSQFINFSIYLWGSKTEKVEEPIEEEEKEESADAEDKIVDEEEEGKVEEEKDEDKPKVKTVDKTTWDWELVNDSKPIWTRKPAEIEDSEYDSFYKSLTKEHDTPLSKIHFVAEGEVTFKSLLFIPKAQPQDNFNRYGKKTENIKLYVRRVFITDDFQDMMPSYLSFVRGVVDSDDLPLNVSRETLQQHKLLKVIKKKLVRKTLDMIKKINDKEYENFWKEYSTNIKLGLIEDSVNRSRLAKLLRFQSSNDKDATTSLASYVERMKPKQEHIYYVAGANREEVETSPFVEKLLRKGYEVLYLIEAVDEYCVNSLPEFEGKKFQNVAKEGFTIGDTKSKEALDKLNEQFEPLTKWLEEDALKDKIQKAKLSERLSDSPCALVAGMFGWTANMERLAVSNAHSKTHDSQKDFYLNQKKTLEVNPRHPLIKELLLRVQNDKSDETAKKMALVLFETATLRSGYMLRDTAGFADRIETMMRQTLGISLEEKVEEEPELEGGDDETISETPDISAEELNEDEQHDEL